MGSGQLASNDVVVKQQLLNHLQTLDKTLVIEASKVQTASMLRHLSDERSVFTHLYTHRVEVGKHRITFIADKEIEGIRLEDETHPSPIGHFQDQRTYVWVFWLIVAVVIVLFFIFAGASQ
jgi:hypothetical protein